jgi:hypothetical protein
VETIKSNPEQTLQQGFRHFGANPEYFKTMKRDVQKPMVAFGIRCRIILGNVINYLVITQNGVAGADWPLCRRQFTC